MVWYLEIFNLGDLANKLKGYLESWVNDLIKYGIETIGITYTFFNDWINYLMDNTLYYYERSKEYAEDLSKDLEDELGLVWDRIGVIPVITKDLVIAWIKPLLKPFTESITSLEAWISDFPDMLINMLYTQKERVTDFIASSFELILDKVFERV